MPLYTIGSGLPSYPVGLTDKEAAIIVPIYSAINTLAQNFSAATGNVQYSQSEISNLDPLGGLLDGNYTTVTVKAGAAIGYGNLVNITAVGSDLVAVPASNATSALHALAICDVTTGIPIGTYGKVIWVHGKSAGISGSVFGTQYWLGTAGTVQASKPTTAGLRAQAVGIGLGSAGFYLNIPDTGVIV